MHEDAPIVPHGTHMRLGELREWHVVVAECWKCGYRAEVQQALLKRMRSVHESHELKYHERR